ncbi:SDR family NAD(P)-dependent oxidoreductase [Alicyclobacillus sp. SP_1]|uniref:SDR family NAD(P)-dependent oxidoreductase n=1 Tax=Alicyclobacillus sp. SP_1 TaxID=2942475 RepID=UPI002157377D|nr:SDR family oxidoreductase [Alicyclobacillus sp. SP_1]
MNGKVVLVTGGGRGIGAETARILASRGAAVVVNYLSNSEAANSLVDELTKRGSQALAIQADVRDEEQVQHLVSTTVDKFGRIDALVSNAAMSFVRKPFLEMSWSEFSPKLNDELKAAFTLTQVVLPHMIQNRYGRIVYVSTGLANHPQVPFIAHGTAKAGLSSFGKYIAKEFGAHGITANVVSPGLVETERTQFQTEEFKKRMSNMTPLGRIAKPEDIARVIAFYVSDDSQFMTGSNVSVDGGLSL